MKQGKEKQRKRPHLIFPHKDKIIYNSIHVIDYNEEKEELQISVPYTNTFTGGTGMQFFTISNVHCGVGSGPMTPDMRIKKYENEIKELEEAYKLRIDELKDAIKREKKWTDKK